MRFAMIVTLVLAACVHAPPTARPVGITRAATPRGERDLAPQLWYPAGAGFAFVPRITWLGRRVRKELCRDLGPSSRAAIHDAVARDVLGFFASALARRDEVAR